MSRLRLNRSAALAVKGAHRAGENIRMPCPVHRGGHDTLSVGEGKKEPVWHCFAGCDANAVRDALIDMGILEKTNDKMRAQNDAYWRKRDAEKLEWIKRLWREGTALLNGEAPQAYFRSRKLPLDIVHDSAPHQLRWHRQRNAILARVSDDEGNGIGLHVTTLHRDGNTTRKAHGTLKGGAIRLFSADPGEMLAIAEGIETAIAFAALNPNVRPVWSLISATGIAGFTPSPCVKHVIVAADFDGAGITAWERLSKRLDIACELRLPGGEACYGSDWNDVWRSL